jgi:hypothetical protein
LLRDPATTAPPGSTAAPPTAEDPTGREPSSPGRSPAERQPDVDPACLLGEDGVGGILGGLGGDGVDGDVRTQIDKIAELVAEERGLEWKHPVTPELLPAKEFDQRVADMVKAEYPVEQADVDSRLLQLLGAVPKGTDLKALQQDLLSGQVAGYYDPDSGDIVVRLPSGADSLDANGQMTLAHELDHALTDQALGLPDTEAPGASDADQARLALVEGDATLLMQRFGLRNLSLRDQLETAASPDVAAAQEELAKAPPYLQEELLFPYTAGLGYACRLQQDGGWQEIDAAYRDLPTTTAEILYADRAGVDAVDPRDVPDAGGAWQQARRDSFGAAPLLWLFRAPGGDVDAAIRDADDAAHRWAGGEVRVFADGARSALGLALVDSADKGRLCDAVERWYTASFDTSNADEGSATVMTGGDQVGALRCDGRDVRLGIAPDQATALTLAG